MVKSLISKKNSNECIMTYDTMPSHDFSSIDPGSYCRFIYIFHGSKMLEINGNIIEYFEGEIIYLAQNTSCKYKNIVNENGLYEQITFCAETILVCHIINNFIVNYGMKLHVCNEIEYKNECVLSEVANCDLQNFFKSLLLLISNSRIDEISSYKNIKFSELIYYIASSKRSNIAKKVIYDSSLYGNKLVNVVYANMYNKKTITQLARICGYSITRFKVEFKLFFKESPYKWVIEQKLTQARYLVLSTSSNLEEITEQCGFCSQIQFVKLFKQKYGETPLQYRKNYHNMLLEASSVKKISVY